MATEREISDLKAHARERLGKFGTNALLKVRGALIASIIDDLEGAQGTVAQVTAPLDGDESAELAEMRDERDNANSRAHSAEREVTLLRAVAEAGEERGRRRLGAATKAYREEFPAAAGSTTERAPSDEDGDENPKDDDAEGSSEGGDDGTE